MRTRSSLTRKILPAPIVLGALLLTTPAIAQSGAGQSAVVLNYQRFGEAQYPETSVEVGQFENQIRMLSEDRYHVAPINTVVDTLFADGLLQNRTVAITIDDAYRSAYEVAWPRLKAAGLPFALFIATDPLDNKLPGFMSWEQVRELRDAGVTIGLHSAGHPHMPALSPAEARADLDRAIASYQRELGERPKLFSYPHGEMSRAARDVVAAAGLTAAFGQHSGVVNATLDRYFLPRFSINAKYGGARDFKQRIDALGLPIRNLSPADPYMADGQAPVIGFTLDDSLGRVRQFTCFYAQGDDDFVEIPITETDGGRVELRFEKTFRPGPWRINCTMPTGGNRYRWFGMQFQVAAD